MRGKWIVVSLAAFGFIGCPAVKPDIMRRAYPSEDPTMQYMEVFRSDIQLPGQLVGAGKEFATGCFKTVKGTTVDGATAVQKEYWEKQRIGAGVRAELEATLAKAATVTGGANAALANEALKHWTVEVEGLQYTYVDPTAVIPEFNNPTCRVPDLDWFANKRAVVVGALRANRVILKSGVSVGAEVKAALTALFDAVGGKVTGSLGVSFGKQVAQDGALEITAENVYFALRTTTLYARLCQAPAEKVWNVKPGQWYEACDYKFQFKNVSATPEQYRLIIEPKLTDALEFLETFDRRTMRTIDGVRLIGIRISKTDSGYSAELSTWLVGPKGSE